MRDSVRVSIESEYEEESVWIHGTSGEVDAGGATFSFDIGGVEMEGEAHTSREGPSDTERDDGSDPEYIAPLEEVPTDSTLRCEARDGRRGIEIILRRDGGEVFAWRNSCPHKPKVALDPGGGAIVDDEQLVCHEHGARFECGDGHCTFGPCRGDALDEIQLRVHDGDVYLADDRFEACTRLG